MDRGEYFNFTIRELEKLLSPTLRKSLSEPKSVKSQITVRQSRWILFPAVVFGTEWDEGTGTFEVTQKANDFRIMRVRLPIRRGPESALFLTNAGGVCNTSTGEILKKQSLNFCRRHVYVKGLSQLHYF